MSNQKQCAVGHVEVQYTGFHLGHGQVLSQTNKIAVIASCPRPKTKKEVRQFLGLAGYYRRFVPNYSDLTSPLTFTRVKATLCGGPLLHAPDFSLPFLLQTDASSRGLGAVLSQEIEGEERPVLYKSDALQEIDDGLLMLYFVILALFYFCKTSFFLI